MSRVKLKRFKVKSPSPKALEKYLRLYPGRDLHYRPHTLPPISSEALFGDAQPLVLDLGSGKGEFVVERAQDDPARNFVGIEWHTKSLWYAVNQAQEANVSNVCFVRSDIRQVLSKVPDQSVHEVNILFPPPITKPSKFKDDFFTTEVLEAIHRLLVEEGIFRFVTDSQVYFSRKVEMVAQLGGFECITQTVAIEGGITAFQQRWERYGIESNRIEYRRKTIETA